MAQINKPTDYFNTVLWTGNGTDDRSITGVGFKPDWVWYKERSNVGDHTVHDIVRGAGERLFTADTSAESLDANSLQAFETDGFQIGTNTDVNGNGETYVGWNWLASNTTASNTDGSITSTVSANTTSGFSIVSWTGTGSATTVGTGLSSTPKLIIVKNKTDAVNWMVYHHSVITASSTNKSFMTLNTTDALGTNGTATTFTSVSDTTFGVGTDNIVNGSGDSMIAYCFAEKKGFSKFGSYTGNGSADGTFVYTGFKPAMVIIKRTDSSTGANWLLLDSKRSDINTVNENLFANLSDAETSTDRCDFLSNGFKLRQTGTTVNTSGGSYIYMCFAESPLVGTNNIPAVAR